MRIDRLEPIPGPTGRIRVVFDGAQSMKVYPEVVADCGLYAGKELSEALDVSSKTWERHRKYLIACAVAVAGDYHCISGYILSREGKA